MTARLEQLDPSQIPQAANLLARAFRDNPLWTAVLTRESADVRQQVFERCALGFLQAAQRHGIVTAAIDDGEISGVSLVFPPGTYPLPLPSQFLMLKGILAQGPMAFLRLAAIGSHTWLVHPRTAHYYLFMIGVDPSSQGKGYGGQLLRHLNELADKAGVECYLETDKPESVNLYEHFGYRVVRDDTIRAANLHMWMMTRPYCGTARNAEPSSSPM